MEAMDSQPDSALGYPHESVHSAEASTSAYLPAGTTPSLTTADPSGSYAGFEQDMDMPEPESSAFPAAGSSATQQEARSKSALLVVRVTKNTHFTSPDEYRFKDKKGTWRTTGRRDWVEAEHEGESGYLYRGNKMQYWCARSNFPSK
ncbi:hypothetical protein GGR52DRAFT_549817 [Hypoxylon sp. FL1284]|nr:hypothetical protein GGR52DRAFT_549817 [Hypoxylon sp. FL1284]